MMCGARGSALISLFTCSLNSLRFMISHERRQSHAGGAGARDEFEAGRLLSLFPFPARLNTFNFSDCSLSAALYNRLPRNIHETTLRRKKESGAKSRGRVTQLVR